MGKSTTIFLKRETLYIERARNFSYYKMNIDSISFLLNHDIFIFGFAPVLAYILGYLCTVIPLEFLIHTGSSIYDKYGLTYLKKDGSRIEALKRTHSRVALSTQVKTVVNVLIGPTAIVNGIFGYFLLSYVIPYEKRKAPSLLVGMMQFLLLEVIGDFFLYWGHRIQHEIPYLWKNFHSLHVSYN
jgi:sterol desaturase/sphingolipid hydroxylase (fatty acid hydroxylase superfamily)